MYTVDDVVEAIAMMSQDLSQAHNSGNYVLIQMWIKALKSENYEKVLMELEFKQCTESIELLNRALKFRRD